MFESAESKKLDEPKLKGILKKKYREEFVKQLTVENGDRLSKAAFWFFIIEVLMYITGFWIDFPQEPVLVFLIVNIFILPPLIKNSKNKRSDKYAELIIYSYVFCGVLLGVFLSVLQFGIRDSLYLYVMFLAGITYFVRLSPLKSLVLITGCYVIFIVVSILYRVDMDNFSVMILNTIPMNILSWLANNYYIEIKYNDFISKQRLSDNNKILKQLSEYDGLTNVFNKRTIAFLLDSAIDSAREKGSKLSIAMLDIDFFKKVNDTYGHTEGDTVLQTFANILKGSVRSCDLVGRYGGEEFLIVFDKSGVEEAQRALQRIKEKVHATEWNHNMKITFSAGISEYRGQSSKELIESADNKLYYVKEHGRNNYIAEIPQL